MQRTLRLGIEVDDNGAIRTVEGFERTIKSAALSADVFEKALTRVEQRNALLSRAIFDQTLRGLSGADREFKSAAQSAAVFEKALNRIELESGRMATITVKDMARMRQEMAGASSHAVEAGAAITALRGAVLRYASAAAIGAAIKGTVDYGDQLSTLSQSSGFTVEALQGLDAAAQKNRTSLEAVMAAADTLELKLSSGDTSVRAALQAMGLEFDQVLAMDRQERFFAVADAIRQMGDSVERTGARTQLLGRGSRDLAALLQTDLRQAVQDSTGMTRDQAEAMAAVDALYKRLTTGVKVHIAEGLEPFANMLTGLADRDIPKVLSGLGDFAERTTGLKFALEQLTGLIASEHWSNFLDALSGFGAESGMPGVAGAKPGMRLAQEFDAAKLSLEEILQISREVTAETDKQMAAWEERRAFFGADVLDDAQRGLDLLGEITNLVQLSPPAFDAFQAELQQAVAYLNQVGDSASGSAAQIRETLAAMLALRHPPAEGGPLIPPGDFIGGGMGGAAPVTPGLPAGEARAGLLAEYENDLRTMVAQTDAMATENAQIVDQLYQEWAAQFEQTESAHGAMTSSMSTQWGQWATAASTSVTQVTSAAQRAFEFLKRSEEMVRAYRAAGIFVNTNSFASFQYDVSMQQQASGAGFSMGGRVEPWMVPSWSYYAVGGRPRGTDVVPAMLTPGEGVLSKTGMSALDRLNAGGLGMGAGSFVIAPGAIVINAGPGQDPAAIAEMVEARIVQVFERFLPARA